MPLPPVLILACGNPSRGDDALGPLLLERLQNWLDRAGLAAGFDLIGDFQFQIEHALDLVGRQLVLFIDAGEQSTAPFIFRQARAAAGRDLANPGTHALSPEAVLAVLAHINHAAPPPAFVLCVRAECFALGAGLSPAASSHAECAFKLLQALCRVAKLEAWMSRLT